MNKNACVDCVCLMKYYGNKDKFGRKVASNYWCTARNGFIKKFPKKCPFKRGGKQ